MSGTDAGRSATPDEWLALVVRRAVTETLPQTTPAQAREITDRVAKWLRQSDYQVAPPDDARPTHDGPCTRSLDGDGEPLSYCAVCFQDMPPADARKTPGGALEDWLVRYTDWTPGDDWRDYNPPADVLPDDARGQTP